MYDKLNLDKFLPYLFLTKFKIVKYQWRFQSPALVIYAHMYMDRIVISVIGYH